MRERAGIDLALAERKELAAAGLDYSRGTARSGMPGINAIIALRRCVLSGALMMSDADRPPISGSADSLRHAPIAFRQANRRDFPTVLKQADNRFICPEF